VSRELAFKATTCTGCGKEIRRRSVHKNRWCEDCRKAGVGNFSKKEEVMSRKKSSMVVDITNADDVQLVYTSLDDRRREIQGEMEGYAKELDEIARLQRALSLLVGDDEPDRPYPEWSEEKADVPSEDVGTDKPVYAGIIGSSRDHHRKSTEDA